MTAPPRTHYLLVHDLQTQSVAFILDETDTRGRHCLKECTSMLMSRREANYIRWQYSMSQNHIGPVRGDKAEPARLDQGLARGTTLLGSLSTVESARSTYLTPSVTH